jgi:hypothetical protein
VAARVAAAAAATATATATAAVAVAQPARAQRTTHDAPTPQASGATEGPSPPPPGERRPPTSLEDIRRQARENWLKLREQAGAVPVRGAALVRTRDEDLSR